MPFSHLLAAVAVAAIWGGNFVSAKAGMQYMPPLLFTGIRFCLTSALLLPLVALGQAPMPTRRQARFCAELSVLLCLLHFGLLFASLRLGLDVAGATLIVQLGVPFSCLLGAVFLHDRIGRWRALGLLVSFLGAAVVAGSPNILEHPAGFWAALGGAFAWGVANIRMKQMGQVNIVTFLATMSAFAAPLLLALSLLIERPDWAGVAQLPGTLWLSMGYTVLLSTLAAYSLWYWLVRTHPVSRVAPFTLLVPIFGILAAQLVYDEPLTLPLILGGVVTLLGVAAITLRNPWSKA